MFGGVHSLQVWFKVLFVNKSLDLRDWNFVIRWSMFGLCADNWESPICCGQDTSRAPAAHAQGIYLYIKPLFTFFISTFHQIKQFVLLQGRTIWIWYVGRVKETSPVDTALLGFCRTGFPRKWYEQNYLMPLMSTAVCVRHHLGAQSRLYRDLSHMTSSVNLQQACFYETIKQKWLLRVMGSHIFGCKPIYLK